MESKTHIAGDMQRASIIAKGFISELDLDGALVETKGAPVRYDFDQLCTMKLVIELVEQMREYAGIKNE